MVPNEITRKLAASCIDCTKAIAIAANLQVWARNKLQSQSQTHQVIWRTENLPCMARTVLDRLSGKMWSIVASPMIIEKETTETEFQDENTTAKTTLL